MAEAQTPGWMKPDFAVTSIEVDPESPPAGTEFTVTVGIVNQGDIPGDAGVVRVWASKPGNAKAGTAGDADQAAGLLEVGETRTLTFTLTAPTKSGTHHARAFVDADNATAEKSEGNNQLTTTYTLGAPVTWEKPDFIVTSIELEPEIPARGGAFRATATVLNQGDMAGDAGLLRMWVSQPGNAEAGMPGDAEMSVGLLDAGESRTFRLLLTAPELSSTHHARAFVDADNVTGEKSEGNNQLSTTYRPVVWPEAAAVVLSDLNPVYDGQPKAAAATTDPAGLTVWMRYNGSDALPVDAGSYDVAATVLDAQYAGAAAGTLIIARGGQTIDFPPIGDCRILDTVDIAPTASSGLPVDVAVVSGPAVLEDSTLSFTGTGEVVLAASQAGDANWNAADNVENRFTVRKMDAAVTLTNLAHTYDGSPKPAVVTSDPEGLTVEITYDGSGSVPVDAGSYVVTATVSDPVYAGSVSETLVIGKVDQVIDFLPVSNQVATNRVILSATASSGLPVGFAVAEGPATLDGAVLSFVAAGQVRLAASQAGDRNWNAAENVEQVFQVLNPPPVPVVNKSSVKVREGGDGRFYVRLSHAPNMDTTVVVTRQNGDSGLSVQSGAALFFTPANWSTWQRVTLTAAQDDNAESEISAFRVYAPGGGSQAVQAVSLDDDIGENLALAVRGTTVSRYAAVMVTNVNDGVHASSVNYGYTIWTNVPFGTMTMDLQGPMDISRLRLLHWDWDLREHRYLIEASADGVDWMMAVDAGREACSGWDERDVALSGVRYLRFTGLSNTVNRVVALAEWEVYGEAHVQPAAQSIDFPEIGDRMVTDEVMLEATATSGLPVAFSVADGPAEIHGATLTFTGAGDVTVRASQAGDANWEPAADVVRTFHVAWPESIVEVHKPLVRVREGGEGRLYIRLSEAPAATVVVTASRSEGEASIRIQSGAARTFTAGNWNTWQPVTLAADEDDNALDETAALRFSTPGRADRFIAAVALDKDIGENIALASRGTTISGVMAVNAGNVIDGIHLDSGNSGYTVWTNEPPGTMTLDLQDVMSASRMRLLNWDWSHRVHRYRVDASLDGVDWTTVADAGEGESSGWDDWALDGRPMRYLRFTGLSNSANRAVCIAEWEVYGGLFTDPSATVMLDGLSQLYDGTPRSVTATTIPEGLPVVITYDGSTTPPVEAGVYNVTATMDDPVYEGSAVGVLEIAKADQTIDFPAFLEVFSNDVLPLAATSGSGLPVAYAVQSGPAVLDGTSLSFTGTGPVILRATQAGDGNWNPAPEVLRTFEVEIPRAVPRLSKTGVNVREDGEGRVFLRLSMAPESNVAVTVSRVDGDTNLWVESGAVLTFTPANWSMWRVVTFAARGDDNAGSETATFRVSMPGVADRFVAATSLDDDFAENLALASRGTVVTGVQAVNVENVIDGIHADNSNSGYTVWTNEPPGTMTLDLQETMAVSRIRLLNWDWSYRQHRYVIEASLDGEEWDLVADAGEKERHGWDDWPLNNRGLRYLRFTGLSNTANRAVCIAEWEVYGASVLDLPPDPAERIDQVIDFPEIGDRAVTDAMELTATASSGLPVSFSVLNGPAVLDGTALNFTGTGEVSILASQAGDEIWNPAPDVIRTFAAVDPEAMLVQVHKPQVNVREGGEGRFYVRLSRAPATSVMAVVSREEGCTGLWVKSGATRTFTAANWEVWQPVTLAAGEDENDMNETAVFRISVPGEPDRFVTATALDDDIGENVALASRGTVVSGVQAVHAGHVIDGIHADSANSGYTVWTNEPPGTMTLDLQEAMAVSRIRLLNWDWSHRVHRYVIEGSLDGETWTMLADAGEGEHSGWEDWPAGDQPMRYLRFTGLSNTANRAVCIAEWEVYGAPAPEGSGSRGSFSTRAVSPAADSGEAGPAGELESLPVVVLTSNGADDESGWNALDGDLETAWGGNRLGGGYLVIGFEPAMTLSAVEVDLDAESLANVEFLYSLDADEWQPLPDDMETRPVELNYLWLVFPDDGTDAVPMVREIRFYP
ncbi:MAG: hypothetical protein GX548_07750 [Lentisphaerae bacterium]|nr:hypothetical protein [Lentisphaerota bacterium]